MTEQPAKAERPTKAPEDSKRKVRCAFTGHRPQCLKRLEEDIKVDLENAIMVAIRDGYTTFITGGAYGVDIWAAEIRTQLLNLVEATPAAMRIANVQEQEVAMLQFAKAMMEGDPTTIAQSVKDLLALKDHTIAAQAASITKLSGEKAALETKAASLTEENGSLSARNESLVTCNRMLAEEAVTWEPRRVANAVMRKIGKAIFNGKYGMAWNEFYRELMYQTGISVGNRGAAKNESGLDAVRDNEWPQDMRTVAAMGVRYCIDVVDVTNEQVVEDYQLDRVETENGIKYNTGIMRTTRLATA